MVGLHGTWRGIHLKCVTLPNPVSYQIAVSERLLLDYIVYYSEDNTVLEKYGK